MAKTDKQLRITWVKSSIGYSGNQKATIKALGLSRLGQSVVRPDNPSIQGMIYKVRHLVDVEEA
jgi:large subunit ribosomal protein L30